MSPQQLTAFHYGGHATFPVRYGWLSKGLDQVRTTGSFELTTETADDLGLGSKMVESLAFWLDVTGLVEAGAKPRGGARHLSDAASLIMRHDRFLELPVTWWFLHLALCRREGTVWSWFFNDYSERVFDRASCAQAFARHTRASALRPATDKTAVKDVSCLLNAYAARPGVDVVSPDDVGACPFRELGLVIRHAVDRFERGRIPVGLAAEAFLASVSLLSRDTGKGALSLREIATLRHGPGRVFGAGLPAIEALVENSSGSAARGWTARPVTLAGELHLEVEHRPLTAWLKDAYSRIGDAT